ncbi:hypothetical protein ASF91_21545 [Rhizobium sp. Leaf155]|nr:hypothetical protein ASF91_21545 [Rhizobium sp. Leaf155]
MSLSTQRRGQLGVNVVERIVIKDWNARWQQIDAHNDDGVDGLIFLERGGKMTGQVIFVQVKCLRISVGKDNMFRVPIDAESLREKLEMWSRVAGAAILVLVDPQTLKACWQSLKDARFTTPTQILVWAASSFDKNSKRQIQIGCGTLNRDLSARTVYSKAEDFEHLLSPLHIQVS